MAKSPEDVLSGEPADDPEAGAAGPEADAAATEVDGSGGAAAEAGPDEGDVPAPATAPAGVAAGGEEVVGASRAAKAPPVAEEDEPYRERWFFDNPSIGRAIRYTFAEKRLARAVFVNALLLVVGLALVQEAFGRGQLGLFSERISYGRVAFLALVAVEALVVSVLAPLGAMFLFEAERREECFDQVVASGVSPHRIVFGRFLATLAFLAVVLFSSLPFFATAVVLDGATVGQVVTAYGVLAAYGVALAAAAVACAVALDDTALPVLICILAAVLALSLGLNRRSPPVFAAWSPVRHAVLDQADIARDLSLGDFRPPSPYGQEVPCAALSMTFYGLLTLLGLGYAFVGPDIELSRGMDSFDSVSVSPRSEATRARRGVARALLRAVQLRFFYENVSARSQALSPLVRAGAMVVIFTAAHAVFLGGYWPDRAPSSFGDIARRTAYPYMFFTMGTLALLALAGAGTRAALLADRPVLRLGPLRLGRFPAVFLIMAFALLVPALLWQGAASFSGWPAAAASAPAIQGLYLLAAGYAAFIFALSLLLAMVTTNPYSATGWSLIVLFATNLIPAIWIPLFRGDLAGEGSAFLLDLSPLSAGVAIARPGETFPFSTLRGDDVVRYLHEPSWRPFAWFHGVLGLGLLVAGLVCARREVRRAGAAEEVA